MSLASFSLAGTRRVAFIAAAIFSFLCGGVQAGKITGVTASVWPDGRTPSEQPYYAVDGNTGTYTWSTQSGTTRTNHLGLDFGRRVLVNRIRLWKERAGNWDRSASPKNLVIQYTTDGGPLSGRTWRNVPNLVNGYRGTELMDARAVNRDGTVHYDQHDSVVYGQGWASLTFDPVEATGLRITFSKATNYTWNHYRVYEFEAHLSAVSFVRGDANGDGARNLADAVAVLEYLYAAGAPLACQDAADADDSGALNLNDGVALLNNLFGLSSALPEPFAACGVNWSADSLDCVSFDPCQ